MIPDNIEKIMMTKDDYDRNVEQLLFDKIKAQMEVERFNNTKNKIIKYIKENILSFNEVDMMDIKVILDMLEDK